MEVLSIQRGSSLYMTSQAYIVEKPSELPPGDCVLN